jgi:hypothetical protein
MPTVSEKIEYALMSPGGEITDHRGVVPKGGTSIQQWCESPSVAQKLRKQLVDALEGMGVHELMTSYVVVVRKTTTVVHDYEMTDL